MAQLPTSPEPELNPAPNLGADVPLVDAEPVPAPGKGGSKYTVMLQMGIGEYVDQGGHGRQVRLAGLPPQFFGGTEDELVAAVTDFLRRALGRYKTDVHPNIPKGAASGLILPGMGLPPGAGLTPAGPIPSMLRR